VRKLRLSNNTDVPVRLNVEPWPDVYYIPTGSYFELSSPLIETGDRLEAVDHDQREITLSFYDVENFQVDVFDEDGTKQEPMNKMLPKIQR